MIKIVSHQQPTLLLVVLCLLLQSPLLAQNVALNHSFSPVSNLHSQDGNKQSLKAVLSEYEQFYGVRFNYAAKLVNDKFVSPKKAKAKTLDESLMRLLPPLGLKYEKLNDELVFITEDKQSKLKKLGPKKVNQNRNATLPLGVLPHVQANRFGTPIPVAIEKRISGTVTDFTDGSTVPGVNVLVKGTTIGTITNAEGQYNLTVPDDATTLVFSSIGYEQEEVTIANQSVIDLVMSPSIEQLSEVVVIGYGTREKKDLTGAISSINGDEAIQKTAAINPQAAMQGRMTGVFVSSPGGDPGSQPEVRIRGVGTFDGAGGYAEPLYVIDGIPVSEPFEENAARGVPVFRDVRGSQNILNTINPADIESISVLKDASAAAIYGVRAANGVILITTKKGQAGRPKVSLNASYGFQNNNQRHDVLTTEQYYDFSLDMLRNEDLDALDDGTFGYYNPNSDLFQGDRTSNDDWQDAIQNKNAPIQDYNLSISGGNEASTYYTSFGYANQEGTLIGSEVDRYSLAINSDHKITDWLKVGEVFRFSKVDANDNVNPDLLEYSQIIPWQPIYTDDGRFASASRDIWGANGSRPNVLGQEATNTNEYETFRSLGNVYAEVSPLAGLRLRGTLNFDYTNMKRTGLSPADAVERFNGLGAPANGTTFRERSTTGSNIQTELLLGYDRSFGDHNINLVLNASQQRIRNELQSTASQNLVFVAPIHNEADANGGGFFTDNALIGYMGRLSYNYASKYYLDATIRRDGTSRFAEDFRYGNFPSVSAAWRISAEDFMQDITFIDDLKIRGGWGQLGNQVTADYQYLALANLNPRVITGGGNFDQFEYQNGVTFGRIANRILSWETVTTSNIGFDGLFFNNSLSLTAEYYTRLTEDILQAVDLPATAGFIENTVENIASVSNTGIEVNLNYNFKIGEVGINIGGNITTVNNEVLSTNRDNNPINLGDRRIEVGQPIGFIWGYKVDRILQTQDEVDAYEAEISDNAGGAKGPGDIVFQNSFSPSDEEGVEKVAVPDTIVDINDRVFLGNTIAGHFYGINLGANFKGFDFSMLWQGVGDVQKINGHRRNLEGNGFGPNKSVTVLNRWTPENTNTDLPRYIYNNPAGNDRISDRWVEDASFVRLRNIQLGYTLPTNVLSKIGASSLRMFVDASNILTITNYSGLDPENDDNPVPAIYRFGINASF